MYHGVTCSATFLVRLSRVSLADVVTGAAAAAAAAGCCCVPAKRFLSSSTWLCSIFWKRGAGVLILWPVAKRQPKSPTKQLMSSATFNCACSCLDTWKIKNKHSIIQRDGRFSVLLKWTKRHYFNVWFNFWTIRLETKSCRILPLTCVTKCDMT